MSQNIYDDPAFFEAYSALRRSVHGLAGAPEWQSLAALLPDMRGRCVVDLGCGFGWFCRYASEQGAAEVLGIDVSENMLRRARDTTHEPAIRYERADLEQLTLPASSFDLVYSSLALHYIAQLPALIEQVALALRPGGALVFSVEHPIYTAPSQPGWSVSAAGHKAWPIDGYSKEGPRTTHWLAEGVVKQHRTLGSYLNLLITSRLSLTHVEEWRPSAQQLAQNPSWLEELERPMFLLVAAQRV